MVFISYSGEDGTSASTVKNELESSDYQCFLAHDDIRAGADWHEEIWNALHESHAFVGLVTDNFNSSPFCQQEIGAALALGKPSLLVFAGTRRRVPGFAARFQAVKRDKLLSALNELPKFRQLRVETWIHATQKADSFKKANSVHGHFRDEWESMTDDEKLRWLLAAASNTQVKYEQYNAGLFYNKMRHDLKPLLTNEWLFDNDKEGVLHNIEENPVGLKKKKRKN